jgi:hypothetical protein
LRSTRSRADAARGKTTTASRRLSSAVSHTTTDLEEIREWAEARGGQPAKVKGTGSAKDPGMLRIDFPGYSGKESLEPISWDEWYQKFQQNNLKFLYQEKTKGGKQSRFFKLVCEPK